MQKIPRAFLFMVIAYNMHTIHAMDQSITHHLVVIPGQNHAGGGNATTIFPHFAKTKNKALIHPVETPDFRIDFGQSRCISYLKQTMDTHVKNNKALVHTSSQGTASGIHYFALYPDQISCLFLEAVMLSGNSAIYHHASNNFPIITSLPGCYYWLPHIVRLWPPYWTYAPASNQPIHNIDKLPQDLPIIIYHCKDDILLPFKDAQALYAALKNTGHDNVYFLSINGNGWAGHVELLTKDDKNAINLFNTILQKHGLPHQLSNETAAIELGKYQPEVKQEWTDHFNELLHKERKVWYVDCVIKTALCSLLAYILYRTGCCIKLLIA